MGTMKTAQAARIDELLDLANGKRKKRRMSRDDVLAAIAEARRSPHGIAFRHAGESNEGSDVTTLCLVVIDPSGDHATVGISACGARGASPGRTWDDLQPWRREIETMKAACAAWAAETERSKKNTSAMYKLGVPRARWTEIDRVRVALDDAPAERPRDYAELLAAIIAAPDDDAPRLVMADALTERGDARGELIHVECALATLPAGSPEATALAARDEELLAAHGEAWSASVRALGAMKYAYRRGFIEDVTMRGQAFVDHGDALVGTTPLRALSLGSITPAVARRVATLPALKGIRELLLHNPGIEGIEAFADRSARVAALEKLSFRFPMGVPDDTRLARMLARLRRRIPVVSVV